MAYIDNFLLSSQQSGGQQSGGSGGTAGTNDLAVCKIEILDSNGNSVGTTLEEGKTYHIRVTYQSGFSVGGTAWLRLYRYDLSQKRLYLEVRSYEYFSPGETVTKDFGTFGGVPVLTL